MKHILFVFILLLFFSGLFSQESPFDTISQYEKSLILGLQNLDPDVRKKSAELIKTLLINRKNVVAKGNVIEHPTVYWQDKIAKYGPVMKKEAFEEIFLNEKSDFIPNYDQVKFFQLDNIHLLRVNVYKRKIRLIELTIKPVFYHLNPPANYTGVWTNYFITGMVSKTTTYKNGVEHGTEIIFYSDGSKCWEKEYDTGRVAKIYRFENGKPIEENISILDVKGESLQD